jgi:LPXTG-motif cell wall-anchored protein
MTIQFNNGVVPTGTFFDIFMCPDQTVVPRDNGDRGECQVVTFWDRSDVENYGYLQDQDPVYSMKWVLSTGPTNALRLNGEPYLDSDGEPLLVYPPGYDEDEPEVFGGWCQFDGWFFSVNDFEGGNNSNWSSAFDAEGCNSAPADLPAAPAPGFLDLDLALAASVGEIVPGNDVILQGSGLIANSPLELVLRSTPVSIDLAGQKANASGSFFIRAKLPDVISAGVHSLTLTGTKPDGNPISDVLYFEIDSDGKLLNGRAGLAKTGANVEWLMVAGLLAAIAGAGFLTLSRRKRTA